MGGPCPGAWTPERKGQGANNSKRFPIMKMTEYASHCLSYIPPSPVSFLGSDSNGSSNQEALTTG